MAAVTTPKKLETARSSTYSTRSQWQLLQPLNKLETARSLLLHAVTMAAVTTPK